MPISLDERTIEATLPRITDGLERYLWLQAERDRRDLAADREYQRRFNHFYRVRRGGEWQRQFYDLLQAQKQRPRPFAEVLETLHRTTGRYEASFASKLVATAEPGMPVIDSQVLRNLSMRLPSRNCRNRAERIVEVHEGLRRVFDEYLGTSNGRSLVHLFRQRFPAAQVTEVKMLDLVLWQARARD